MLDSRNFFVLVDIKGNRQASHRLESKEYAILADIKQSELGQALTS